jgi:hypothetical protein
MTNLHITNGDCAANILKASGLEGDVLPWRDPMHHGPFVPSHDLDAVSKVRARYLAGAPDAYEDVARSFRLRDAHLRAANRYGEVILWFEHDLLDQLQILQLLDWFSGADLGAAKLSMICIDHFPGVEPFLGLGQLSQEQMTSLYRLRQPVTQEQFKLAVNGWAAFRSPDPTALEAFMTDDLNSLPFLRAALARHLEEYPWTIDGLTRSERQLLKIVAEGIDAPGALFVRNMECETVLFEGDLRTFKHIEDLCSAPAPLLNSEPYGVFHFPPNKTISRADLLGQRLRVTSMGEQVLAGAVESLPVMLRDEWLGGVHLSSAHPMWMWNPDQKKLRLMPI